MPLLEVQVDAMSAQGAGNLALELVRADGGDLPAFAAGAHVDVHLPNGLVRQYSIASAPAQTSRYLLCVRRETASRGGSAFVHERLRVGDRLRISTPRNLFALRDGRHHVLVAGGIGITPLMAMAHDLRAAGCSFELHYYARSLGEIAFRRLLQAGLGQGAVHLHCADEGRDARQRLPDVLDHGDASHHLYLCGPVAFMDHVSAAAKARGWPAGNIHSEAFAPAVATTQAVAGDVGFEVQLASSGQVFAIAPGRTIASVLCEAGVGISLSCEMGMCGACLTDVVEGVPDHRDTVQSAQEKSSNRQMTLCCSRSHSPRLTLAL